MSDSQTIDIERVAIIGSGVMGTKVAWACAASGLKTKLHDRSSGQLDAAMTRLAAWFSDPDISGEDGAEQSRNLRPCERLDDALADVDLVFENVPEDLDLKRAVHAEIGRLLPPRTLMGSNASSLTCSPLAEASGRPDRFFNMNFTDPRQHGLVELMPCPQTAPATVAAAKGWARRLGMVPVVTRKEIMGYAFNRIWRAIKKESLFLADQGYADIGDIDRAFMLTFGTPCGPFGLMDQVGLSSIQKVEQQYYEASGDESDRPPKILNELVAAGALGENAGRGFYTYPDPDYARPGWLTKEPPWDDD